MHPGGTHEINRQGLPTRSSSSPITLLPSSLATEHHLIFLFLIFFSLPPPPLQSIYCLPFVSRVCERLILAQAYIKEGRTVSFLFCFVKLVSPVAAVAGVLDPSRAAWGWLTRTRLPDPEIRPPLVSPSPSSSSSSFATPSHLASLPRLWSCVGHFPTVAPVGGREGGRCDPWASRSRP